ncbi:MAG: toxic anion resistance protein [Oscillospiraceae bacterium]|nr:toxic anion resistance protein [Oscillospiraceae bacterium]
MNDINLTFGLGEPELQAAETQKEQETPISITPIAPVTQPDFTAVAETAVVMPDSSSLTEAEMKMVADFAQKIDIKNSAQVLQYGGQAQKKISGFSEQALANVRTKELDGIGDMISGLVVELKKFEIEDSGKKRLFAKQRDELALKKAEFANVEKNIDRITGTLEGHKITLLKDVHMLDQMYEKNLEYYKELTMYIIAGRQKLQEVIEKELPVLQKKAIESGLAEDAQEANYLADMCNRFDKKLHDIELTRMISVQMSPQIRLVQSTNNIMIEKIHSSIVNTIPLWKNQMVLALGMAHSQAAIKAQREVTDVTNSLLRKNADALKQNTIEAAKESERSIVDIETLRHTNQSLISTLDEVLQIQQTGREKRREAQVELQKIENELKTKLLDIRDAGRPPVVEAGEAAGGLKLE